MGEGVAKRSFARPDVTSGRYSNEIIMGDIISLLKNRVLVYDGAMGTMLQASGLASGACPEKWNLTAPDKVLAVHKAYVDAGADIVETNTFGGNRLSLKKYGLEDKCYKINYEAVKIAKKASKYVAGSVGPVPDKEQIKALSDAGCDLIILETFSDIKELKDAVIAVREVCDLPIQAQLTYTTGGRTISGTPPEVAVAVLEGLGVEIIGANCSLGPKELLPVIERLVKSARPTTYLSIMPNAGLPKIVDKKATYDLKPGEMAKYAKRFYELGVNLIGGCCGTNPEHIKAIAKILRGKRPVKRKGRKIYLTAASRTQVVEFIPGKGPYIIGERINPSRRKDLVDELCLKRSVLIRSEAEEQVNSGAHLVDINVSTPGIDEPSTMKWVVDSVQQAVPVPIVIDSSNPKTLEEGLMQCVGKPIVNSINGEKKKLREVLPLVKKYGAAVIGLTMDDKGIPMTVEKRLAIAEKIVKEAAKFGIHREDVLIDFLTLTAGAQPESTEITLKCIKRSKWQTVLGISNVSFGLPNRPAINSAFLTMAVKEGLTSAIMNPKDAKMQETISSYRVLFGSHGLHGLPKIGADLDPLYKCILTGDKDNIVEQVEKYLAQGKDPVEINEKILIPSLTEVGKRFEKREYFLPQLLLSAEAMQRAVARLEKAFPKGAKKEGASILMATVKGDMHDIGKNIVCSVLKNYGYNVLDLGKDVSHEEIIKTVKAKKVDVVGLSALMTTTMGQMEVVINELKKRGINIPTIIGGAVVTSNYAKQIGAAGYAKDAIGAVNEVKRVLLPAVR